MTPGEDGSDFKGRPLPESGAGRLKIIDFRLLIADLEPQLSDLDFQSAIARYIVLISRLRHRYQHATDRYGSQAFAIFSICAGLGILRFL